MGVGKMRFGYVARRLVNVWNFNYDILYCTVNKDGTRNPDGNGAFLLFEVDFKENRGPKIAFNDKRIQSVYSLTNKGLRQFKSKIKSHFKNIFESCVIDHNYDLYANLTANILINGKDFEMTPGALMNNKPTNG